MNRTIIQISVFEPNHNNALAYCHEIVIDQEFDGLIDCAALALEELKKQGHEYPDMSTVVATIPAIGRTALLTYQSKPFLTPGVIAHV